MRSNPTLKLTPYPNKRQRMESMGLVSRGRRWCAAKACRLTPIVALAFACGCATAPSVRVQSKAKASTGYPVGWAQSSFYPRAQFAHEPGVLPGGDAAENTVNTYVPHERWLLQVGSSRRFLVGQQGARL